jgi:LmbE family N-acetylglucosaminyl deacetylase
MTIAHRIMVVEDEPSAAQLFKRWLSAAGYEVVVAPTAENALTRIAQTPNWDMVLTDVELPGRSGLELLRTLHERFPRMPVLLTSGRRSTDVAAAAVEGGALSFLLKPMDKQTLVDRVDSTFGWLARSKVVLAIGAHPNNVELGCGGALLKHRQAGHQVVILTLSQGSAAHVQQEASEAAGVLGARLYQERLDQQLPGDVAAVTQSIRRVIQEVNPTWIYTHCAEDTHPSHRMVHKATLAVAHGIPNLFCYQTQSTTPDFRPSRFVEIGSQLSTKQEALSSYVSQLPNRPFLQPEMVQASAVYWGRYAGYRLVEPFTVVREDAGHDSPLLHA